MQARILQRHFLPGTRNMHASLGRLKSQQLVFWEAMNSIFLARLSGRNTWHFSRTILFRFEEHRRNPYT